MLLLFLSRLSLESSSPLLFSLLFSSPTFTHTFTSSLLFLLSPLFSLPSSLPPLPLFPSSPLPLFPSSPLPSLPSLPFSPHTHPPLLSPLFPSSLTPLSPHSSPHPHSHLLFSPLPPPPPHPGVCGCGVWVPPRVGVCVRGRGGAALFNLETSNGEPERVSPLLLSVDDMLPSSSLFITLNSSSSRSLSHSILLIHRLPLPTPTFFQFHSSLSASLVGSLNTDHTHS